MEAHETGEDGRGLGEWVRIVFAYITRRQTRLDSAGRCVPAGHRHRRRAARDL